MPFSPDKPLLLPPIHLLKFRKGDLIQLVSNVQQANKDNLPGAGWLYGKLNNQYGNFPSDYVEPVGPGADQDTEQINGLSLSNVSF